MKQLEIFTGEEVQQLLKDMRSAAVKIALETGEVSADDVRAVVPIPSSITRKERNALGSLFKCKDFAWKGVKKSATPSRAGSMISVWALSDNYKRGQV